MIVDFALENDANDFHYHWQAEIELDTNDMVVSYSVIGQVICMGYDYNPAPVVNFQDLPLPVIDQMTKKMETYQYTPE